MLRTNSGSLCRWLRMIPSLGTMSLCGPVEGAFEGDVLQAQLRKKEATPRRRGAAPACQGRHKSKIRCIYNRALERRAVYWNERVRLMQHWGGSRSTPCVQAGYFRNESSRNHNGLPGWAGTVKRKIAPPSGLAVTHKRPACASMIERQIDSPIPRPPGFVV